MRHHRVFAGQSSGFATPWSGTRQCYLCWWRIRLGTWDQRPAALSAASLASFKKMTFPWLPCLEYMSFSKRSVYESRYRYTEITYTENYVYVYMYIDYEYRYFYKLSFEIVPTRWRHRLWSDFWKSKSWFLEHVFCHFATGLEVPLTYIGWFFSGQYDLTRSVKCWELSGLVLSLGLACVALRCFQPLGHHQKTPTVGYPGRGSNLKHPKSNFPFFGHQNLAWNKGVIMQPFKTELFFFVAMLISTSHWVTFRSDGFEEKACLNKLVHCMAHACTGLGCQINGIQR